MNSVLSQKVVITPTYEVLWKTHTFWLHFMPPPLKPANVYIRKNVPAHLVRSDVTLRQARRCHDYTHLHYKLMDVQCLYHHTCYIS